MCFAKKITRLRKEKGLTQSQLAEMLNISNKTVSRWETGEGYPEITLLKPLATALGTTVDDLLEEESSNPEFSELKEKTRVEVKEKEWSHEEIPADMDSLRKMRFKKFGQSLTIFNKIAAACFVISLAVIPFSVLLAIFTTPYFIGPLLALIPSVICYIGIIAAGIGVITSLFDLYKRQLKVSVILLIINVVSRYVLTFILMGINFITYF